MDKKTILAIVLVGLIIIFTQTEYYKGVMLPPPQNVPADSSFVEDIIERPRPSEQTRELFQRDQNIASADEAEKLENKIPKAFSSLDTVQKVEIINIVSNLFDAKISNKGGGLIQWKLNTYLDADSNYVNLVPNTEVGVPGVGMVLSQDSIQFNNYIYSSIIHTPRTGQTVFLENENDLFIISYRLDFPEGKSIEKKFTFYGNRYDFDLELNLVGFANLVIDRSYRLRWDSSLLPTEFPLRDDLSYNKVYAYLGDDLQDFDLDDNERGIETKEVTGTVHWASLRTKYFCAAIAPIDVKGRSITYWSQIKLTPQVDFTHYNFSINMPFAAGTNQLNRFSLYLGPIEYNKLKAVNFELEELIMNSGTYESLFRPFSILILKSLKFLHNYISNYGIVIIIFSILIKIILYPLTHKSYTSMKKMSLVQPLMTELREKHKKDPQRLNKEMMKLYKDHGVNPLGGCLPMLLQMPLLIGLFIVFRSTIELRGAEFFWWISDLSKPDTIFMLPFSLPIYGNYVTVLPIVMALSMFLQQKSTMGSDPRQKMMMYFMPVFFLLLFNTFPSGLNLYYTLFNFLTILQQKFVKIDAIQLKPVEKKPLRNRRSKK